METKYELQLVRELNTSKATPMASAATVEIGYADGNTINITGTTTITSLGAPTQDGVERNVIFDGILTLTHSTSLKLPGEVNIVTAAGDRATFVADTTTTWTCISYTRADIAPDSPILLAAPPVSGVQSTVTIDMTAPTSDMTYTAVEYGADGDNITVTHTDPSGNDEVLAVTVSGTDIDISLATDGGGTITTIASEVKAAVNAHAAASLLVLAEDEGAGTGLVNADSETNLANGVDVTAGGVLSFHVNSAGTILYVKVATQVWKQVTLNNLA